MKKLWKQPSWKLLFLPYLFIDSVKASDLPGFRSFNFSRLELNQTALGASGNARRQKPQSALALVEYRANVHYCQISRGRRDTHPGVFGGRLCQPVIEVTSGAVSV